MIIDIVKIVSKNRMTLTKSIRKALDLKQGDLIAFVADGDHLYMVKISEKHLIDVKLMRGEERRNDHSPSTL